MQDISKIVITVVILSCGTLAGEQTSFFMNDLDSKKALSLAKQDNEVETQNPHKLKLSGIFFIDDQNWTIWLNNTAYSEYGQYENFSIDDVSEFEVTITNSDNEIVTLFVQ